MSTKRKLPSSTPQPVKKERKAINLDTKMMVIKQYEVGKKVNMIARDMKLSHSTVSTILKDKERIREAVKGSAPMQSTVITKQRTGPIHEMEILLHIWMEDQIKKQTPLSFHTVQTKARSLFQTLKERAGEDYSQEFLASTGWFKRFKKRFQLHNVGVTGEALNADEEEACKFLGTQNDIMAEGLFLKYEMEDVKVYLDQESGELTNEKMIEVERVAEIERREWDVSERMFTNKGLSEGFSLLNKLLAHFKAMDPNIERFARIEQMMHDAFYPYCEIYDKMQTVEAKLTMFMKRATPPASPRTSQADVIDNPQPSTSDVEQTRLEDQSSSEQRLHGDQHTERLKKGSCTPSKSSKSKHQQLGIEPPLGELEPKKEICEVLEIKVEEDDLSTSNDQASNSSTIDPLEMISSTSFPSTDQLRDNCSDSNSMSVRQKRKMDVASDTTEDPAQYTQTAKMVGQLLATLPPSAQLQMTAEVMRFIVERLPKYKKT